MPCTDQPPEAALGCPPDPAAEARRMLEEYHTFPGSYMFKIIGFAREAFAPEVRAAAEAVLGPLEEVGSLRGRPSSGGKYLAVTLEVEVANPDQVLAIYAGLRLVAGVVVLV
ncbi:MAG: DUF493 domain-containing protein [Deltaproteobacteria bacterium]|nr:DUF493 domain-containing protein [Deltaproteobacteria bacterium]